MRISQNRCFKYMALIIFVLMNALSAHTVCAATKYVSDQLVITLREGPGNEYRVIKTIKTDARLETIDEADHHYKVKTENGLEGWVLKQYVTGKTPKTVMIADLKRQKERLSAELARYKEEKASLQTEIRSAKSDLGREIDDIKQKLSENRKSASETARELQEITVKYNALVKDSREIIDIVKERDSLKETNSIMQVEAEQLQLENDKLKRSQMIWWFVAGGGVFFVGWIVGKVSRQKRFY